MRFRKKPVEVEAMRYDGPAWVTVPGYEYPRQHPEFEQLRRFVGSKFTAPQVGSLTHGGRPQYGPAIITREGTMRVSPGDWVVKGTRGEFYPCKPDAFADTFEAVDA